MFKHIRIYFSKDKAIYAFIKNILGFYPNNIFLYELAFWHRSTQHQSKQGYRENNERLEYLGDAVLSAVVADYLYRKYPLEGEGFLTEMRSKIVSRKSLNQIAHKMGLSEFIKKKNAYSNSFKSIDGDALEALIGAVYLDRGYKFAKKAIIRRILHVHLDIKDIEHTEWNFKSKLLNAMQKERKNVLFKVVDTTGNGHKKLYHVEVIIDDQVVGKGQDYSIKAAEQMAAERAFEKLQLSN